MAYHSSPSVYEINTPTGAKKNHRESIKPESHPKAKIVFFFLFRWAS